MSASKKEILNDIKFCHELMDRLEEYVKSNYDTDKWWNSHPTVIQSDITRLRRELMNVHHKLEWNYGGK